MPVQLLDLPSEVLNNVLRQCHPSDLGKLCQCCSDLSGYIRGSHLLHKEIYTIHFDKSRLIPDELGAHYEQRLQKYTKLLKLLESTSRDVKRAHFPFIVDTICELLADSSCTAEDGSRNTKLLADRFEQADTDALLCQSNLFARIKGETRLRSQATDSQLSAKLHCLYGVPIRSGELGDEGKRGATYPYAISKVYDLRSYTTGTLWGPFSNDGRRLVDWEMMEAVMIVLGHNLNASRECTMLGKGIWAQPFAGAMPYSYVASGPPRRLVQGPRPKVPPAPELPLGFDDPYGISGTWMRIVCFLDFRDLVDYNFANPVPRDEPRAPYATEEATRLITMRLRVVGYGEHEEFDDESKPVIAFVGATLPIHAVWSWDVNAHATMRGTVRTTKEGEVRWTSYSVFHGEERWKSEGIQIGGVRSARGVVGTWFDKDFDPRGPAGPTAFWKVSDNDADVDDEDEEEDDSDDDSLLHEHELETTELS